MRDLIRETAMGHKIRVLDGERLLPYPEELPGFVMPAAPVVESTSSSEAASATPSPAPSTLVGDDEARVGTGELGKVAQPGVPPSARHVGWYGENDSVNPQNWSCRKKGIVVVPLCFLTFAVSSAAAAATWLPS